MPNRPAAVAMSSNQVKTVRGTLYILSFFVLSFFISPFIFAQEPDDFAHPRERMVKWQIIARGVNDARVIRAMEKVPRHRFVPERYRALS